MHMLIYPYCIGLFKVELPQCQFITVPAPVDIGEIEPVHTSALTSSLHLQNLSDNWICMESF